MSAKSFKIQEDKFDQIKRAFIRRSALLIFFATCAALAIHYVLDPQRQINLYTYSIGTLVVIAFLTFRQFRKIHRQLAALRSYQLTISDNFIQREQYDVPSISIPLQEIREIVKNTNGSFIIKGKSLWEMIFVPAQIDDYEKLEKLLTAIKPIVIKIQQPTIRKTSFLIFVFITALIAIVAFSHTKILVGVAGSTLLGLSVYLYYLMVRHKKISLKFKQQASILFLIVFASLVAAIYYRAIL